MMTSAQVVETSVNVTSNSPSQDYTHPDDHNLPNYGSNKVLKHDRYLVWKFTIKLNKQSVLKPCSPLKVIPTAFFTPF